MSLRDYLRALRKYWWLALLCTVLGGASSLFLVSQATPIYEGKVTFFAATPGLDSASPLQGDQFGQQRVNSYVKLLNSQRLAEKVLEDPDIELSSSEVMQSVTGTADLNTVLLTAAVRGPSPEQVRLVVDGLASQFPELVEEIESQGGRKEAPVQLDVVSGPSFASDPVSPMSELWVAVGLFLGLLLGLAIGPMRELLDRSVRTAETLRRSTSAPVLGRIPFDGAARTAPLLRAGDERWFRTEAFRQLRTNLQFVDIEKPVSVLVVTSSVASEGKSGVSANLAIAFAEADKRVLLVDADLRRPTLAKTLSMEGAVGLTNVLAGHVELDEVVQHWEDPRLTFLASGPTPPNPSELLGSEVMVRFLEQARASYDLVIVDTAPLLPVTDGAVVSARADGAVVVVRYGKTRTAEVESAIESLRAVDARVLGTILNQIPPKAGEGHSYDGYGYYRREAPAKRRRWSRPTPSSTRLSHRDA